MRKTAKHKTVRDFSLSLAVVVKVTYLILSNTAMHNISELCKISVKPTSISSLHRNGLNYGTVIFCENVFTRL